MGKIIQFPQVMEKRFPQIVKLKELSDDIDEVIYSAKVQKDIPMLEIIGVLAHRLGVMLQKVDEKPEVWEICQEIIKEQSLLD